MLAFDLTFGGFYSRLVLYFEFVDLFVYLAFPFWVVRLIVGL